MDLVEINGEKVPATYLGDAVYAIYDGYNCILRLNDHRNEEGQIYLEPSAVNNLNSFILQCNELRNLRNEREESENLASSNE